MNLNGEAAGDVSGGAVAISHNAGTIAIGANNNAGGGTLRGHVRVYMATLARC